MPIFKPTPILVDKLVQANRIQILRSWNLWLRRVGSGGKHE
jgi:hypothetical protein